jgi:autotransporter-associated beta strand protein
MVVLAAAMAAPVAAADNLWTGAAGNGTWDTISANWTNPVTWDNGALDVAVFGPTGAGVVTLGETITLSGIRFEAPGYVIPLIGSGGTLQLPAGADGLIHAVADATVGAQLSGAGQLTKTGAGTLTLAGNNTYAGGTLVSEGTLRIGDGGSTGSVTGLITNNAEVVFNRSNTLSLNGSIIGSGHVTKLGPGTLSGSFFHTGGTTVSEGILRIGLGLGNSEFAGNVTNNAAVHIGTGGISHSLYSGAMSGSGSFIKPAESNSTLVFTGTNTYSGGTRIISGTLQLGDGGSTGSITGDVVVDSNGVLAFNRSNNMVLAGAISGAGRLNKLGDGVTTLSGANTYTGGTTISAGTLSVGDGGTSGSITGNVTNNAVLAFNRSDAITYAGVISGAGSVKKMGAGTLSLTGANTYSGGTTVQQGTLSIGSVISTGYIANNATVTFSHATGQGFSGTIAGTGNVVKLGAGRFTLTGALTHSGGTTVSAGILQVGSSNATGHLGGNVVNNSAVEFARPGDLVTYAGNMSGTGLLLKSGAGGQLALTGANTYTGGTSVTSGTLQIGDGGTSGSIAGSVNASSGAVLAFHRSDPFTFPGNISGGGSIRKLGGNTLTLTGATTVTGGTTIFDGTLAIGDGTTAGSITGNIINNAALTFNQPADSTFTGIISGPGSLAKAGPGMLRLTGANTLTGGTTVSAGTLSIGAGGSIGSLTGSIVNNAAVVFDRSNSTNNVFAGNMTGSGAVTKQGTGVLTLTGRLLHTGGTTVSAGTLSIGNTTAPGGSVEGDIFNNANVTFSRPDNTTYGHVISGTGSVLKSGTGTLTLTGANTYAGDTFIASGALQLGAGGTTGSIAGNVNLSSSQSSLVFDRSDDVTFAGVIAGDGNVTKQGANRLTLTGESTLNGEVRITVGTLRLDATASISQSDVEVFSGATLDVSQLAGGLNFDAGKFALATGQRLRGSGTVNGALAVRVGATLAPGPFPYIPATATLNVIGDVDFQPGSSLEIDASLPHSADSIVVSGALTFAGAADNPFSINVRKTTSSPAESTAFAIAAAASIGSTALDEPLWVEVGPEGTGVSTNAHHIRLSALGFDAGDTLMLLRSEGTLRLHYLPAIAADFDDDGVVDGDDLARWTASAGLASGATNEQGDADADGDVDGADFLTWQRQLGNGPSVPAAPVPEPAAAALVLSGLLAAIVLKRTRSTGQSGQS